MSAMSDLKWRKSSFSQNNGACVELAQTSDGQVAVRDSKNPTGPVLIFTRAEIGSWLAGARACEFDDLT